MKILESSPDRYDRGIALFTLGKLDKACDRLVSHINVISALKTSGIEKLVNHRDVILPQLAATGIESKVIEKKTGWRMIWGPVYAKDIVTFIEKNFRKTKEMGEMKFPWKDRFEIAVS